MEAYGVLGRCLWRLAEMLVEACGVHVRCLWRRVVLVEAWEMLVEACRVRGVVGDACGRLVSAWV